MTINFNKQLVNLLGDGYVDEKGLPLTLGKVSAEALITDCDESTPLSQKLDRYHLARQVIKGGEFELIPACVQMIKESIGRKCNIVLMGSAFDILEG